MAHPHLPHLLASCNGDDLNALLPGLLGDSAACVAWFARRAEFSTTTASLSLDLARDFAFQTLLTYTLDHRQWEVLEGCRRVMADKLHAQSPNRSSREAHAMLDLALAPILIEKGYPSSVYSLALGWPPDQPQTPHPWLELRSNRDYSAYMQWAHTQWDNVWNYYLHPSQRTDRAGQALVVAARLGGEEWRQAQEVLQTSLQEGEDCKEVLQYALAVCSNRLDQHPNAHNQEALWRLLQSELSLSVGQVSPAVFKQLMKQMDEPLLAQPIKNAIEHSRFSPDFVEDLARDPNLTHWLSVLQRRGVELEQLLLIDGQSLLLAMAASDCFGPGSRKSFLVWMLASQPDLLKMKDAQNRTMEQVLLDPEYFEDLGELAPMQALVLTCAAGSDTPALPRPRF